MNKHIYMYRGGYEKPLIFNASWGKLIIWKGTDILIFLHLQETSPASQHAAYEIYITWALPSSETDLDM